MNHSRHRALYDQRRMLPCVFGVFVLLFISPACIPSTPPGANNGSIDITTATPEELLAEWMLLATDPAANATNPRAYELVGRLSTSGATALMPLVDVLADAESNPYKKVFAVQCLARHMTPAYVVRLGELAESAGDGTTRASAVTLLGFIADPEVDPMLRRYVEDSERRVGFAAKVGLARRGDESTHAALVELYPLPDTSPQEREQILALIVDNPRVEHLPLLSRVLVATELPLAQRTRIAAVLGRLGDAHAVDALRISLEASSDPIYETIARAAIEAIQEREKRP